MLRRFFAYLIDWYITYFVMNTILVFTYGQVFGSIVTNVVPIEIFDLSLQCSLLIIFIIFHISYMCILPLFFNGQTLGKKICKIKINSLKSTLSFIQLCLRNFIILVGLEGCLCPINNYIISFLSNFTNDFVISILSGAWIIISIISLFLMIFSRKKQMIHDIASGTIVCMIK